MRDREAKTREKIKRQTISVKTIREERLSETRGVIKVKRCLNE